MIYVYDGSFEGLLTVIFDSYKVLEDLDDIVKKNEQINFFKDSINCLTDLEKAERVKKSVIKNFSYSFYNNILMVFFPAMKKRSLPLLRPWKNYMLRVFIILNLPMKM